MHLSNVTSIDNLMHKANHRKGKSKTFKGNNLYGPSFDFFDIVARLNKLKSSGVNKKSMFIRDEQNRLPLYRPFAILHRSGKPNHAYKLSAKDLPCTIPDEEVVVKNRRQFSQKIENFELRLMRVETTRGTRKETIIKRG